MAMQAHLQNQFTTYYNTTPDQITGLRFEPVIDLEGAIYRGKSDEVYSI